MRVGQLVSLPNEYSRFAQIKDDYGVAYTVDPGQLPKDAEMDTDYAYRVEIWGNDSGMAYELEKA
jgi:hypothetical protein